MLVRFSVTVEGVPATPELKATTLHIEMIINLPLLVQELNTSMLNHEIHGACNKVIGFSMYNDSLFTTAYIG